MIRWNLHSPASANGAVRSVSVSPGQQLGQDLGQERGLLGVGLT